MGREAVSFNKSRSLFRDGHIPGNKAHLRNLHSSFHAHLFCFFPEGNLETDDAGICHRMLDKRVPLLVSAYRA